MANKSSGEEKQQKRELKQLLEASRELQSQGDYQQAHSLWRRIQETTLGTDLAAQAAVELDRQKLDRKILYGGLFATALYGAAWMYVLL